MIRMLIALFVCVITIACGSDSGSNGGSSPSAPTPVRIADYSGNWSGNYTVTGCTQNGQVAAANVCSSMGQSLPYRFTLTQSTRNVSGTFSLGSITFPSTGGSVGQDGSLGLSSTHVDNTITIVVDWALNNPGNAVSGTITQRWTSTGLSGQAVVAGQVSTAVRGLVAVTGFRTLPTSLADAVRMFKVE